MGAEFAIVLFVLLAVFVLAVPIFYAYLLWNRKTKDYFSAQSVAIREQYRRRR